MNLRSRYRGASSSTYERLSRARGPLCVGYQPLVKSAKPCVGSASLIFVHPFTLPAQIVSGCCPRQGAALPIMGPFTVTSRLVGPHLHIFGGRGEVPCVGTNEAPKPGAACTGRAPPYGRDFHTARLWIRARGFRRDIPLGVVRVASWGRLPTRIDDASRQASVGPQVQGLRRGRLMGGRRIRPKASMPRIGCDRRRCEAWRFDLGAVLLHPSPRVTNCAPAHRSLLVSRARFV